MGMTMYCGLLVFYFLRKKQTPLEEAEVLITLYKVRLEKLV